MPESTMDMITEVSLTNLTTVTTIEFADLLAQVGYKESGVMNGSLYYREALKNYLLPMKLLGEDEYHQGKLARPAFPPVLGQNCIL